MICSFVPLGEFDRCEDVVIDELDDNITITNTVTHWNCDFVDGTVIGRLAPGTYTTELDGINYIFEVV